jgi:alginate O-acetyltransferase complex protein AlgI
MLFNSLEFVLFLVGVLASYELAARWSPSAWRHRMAVIVLLTASLFFYSYWNWRATSLLLASVAFNYVIGSRLGAGKSLMLAVGVSLNLIVLGVFKYCDFFIDSMNSAFALSTPLLGIALPLGISFFTFHQVIYLVDVHKGRARAVPLDIFCLYVCFFPQLIAGPISRISQMTPQFLRLGQPLSASDLAIGLTIFSIGLFKKVAIADPLGAIAQPIFDLADTGQPIKFVQGWSACLTYTLQIYFDFSGYSEMALGLSKMFGILLPINFNTPYRSTSVIEFWRRWHMTLSDFLRTYLYEPLGAHRHGPARHYANLMIVMVLGGLWHGAAWTMVIWGALHGLLLIIAHLWRAMRFRLNIPALPWPAAWLLTFAVVSFGWVIFRASSLDAALNVLAGMAGFHGIDLPAFQDLGIPTMTKLVERGVPALALISLACTENIRALMGRHKISLEPPVAYDLPFTNVWKPLTWRPTPTWAAATTGIIATAFFLVAIDAPSQFLYFLF